jgi:membrane protein
MGKKKKQEEKHTKVKIESISLEMYDHNKKLVPQFERPIDAPDAKQNKDNIDTDNSAEKLQQNEKKGLIEWLKVAADLLPLMSGIIIIAVVIVQMHYATTAEQFYNIEGNLFYSENVYSTLIGIGLVAIPNLLFPIWLLCIYSFERKFSLLFALSVLLTCMLIFCVYLYNVAEIINQGISPADVVDEIILKHPILFNIILSILGTVGFCIMINNIAVPDIIQKLQVIINDKTKSDKEDNKEDNNKGGKGIQCANLKFNKKNGFTIVITIICALCVLSAAVAIGAWLQNFYLGGELIINRESYPRKKTYEIVQNNNYPELNTTLGQVASASNFQVVILHCGSQVLLMNGEIDGHETINPQEDMSSSNLWIDTKSYEFQEASQYRFYKKEFKHVTTNASQNNDRQ